MLFASYSFYQMSRRRQQEVSENASGSQNHSDVWFNTVRGLFQDYRGQRMWDLVTSNPFLIGDERITSFSFVYEYAKFFILLENNKRWSTDQLVHAEKKINSFFNFYCILWNANFICLPWNAIFCLLWEAIYNSHRKKTKLVIFLFL